MGDNKSPLARLRPTAPLANKYLLCHHHHMLTRHLPGLDYDLQMVQGLLIATHIREVAVEFWQDREAKAQAQKSDNKKGISDLLGEKLTSQSVRT